MEIPGFTLLNLVGEGAMAHVWKARQHSLDRVVALKMLKPHVAGDPQEVSAFVREARAAAALKHPNIVQIYDIAQNGDAYYLVLEFVDGPTAGTLLKREGKLPHKTALKIALFTAEALQYAWEKAHLVHRDIKPHNILLDADGTVKLSDLGLARIVSSRSAGAAPETHVEGTPNYASPEQAEGRSTLDFRSDMYSLGATLYHLVTGRLPFAGYGPHETLQMHVTGQIPNPRDVSPDVPISTAQLIQRLMMKAPADRFASWDEAVTAIRRAAAGRISLETAPTGGQSTVAPPAPAAPPPGSAGAAARARMSGADQTPRWLNTVLWLILLGAWGLFVQSRMNQPPLVPIPDRHQEASALSGGETKPASPARPVAASQSDYPEGYQPSAEPADESGSRTAAAAPAAPVNATQPPKAPDALAPLLKHLYAGDFAAADAWLSEQAGLAADDVSRLRFDTLREFVAGVSKLPAAIEEEFMRQVGTRITVNHNGQVHTILLRSIVNGKANGELLTSDDDRQPVSFAIAQLSPLERSRWIGEANTPVKCAMKFVLLAQGGDFAAASRLASQCGPLAAVFQRDAASRVPASTPRTPPAPRRP